MVRAAAEEDGGVGEVGGGGVRAQLADAAEGGGEGGVGAGEGAVGQGVGGGGAVDVKGDG